MHVIVRSYSGSGASELFDVIEQHSDDVRELIGEIPGFVSYAAARTGDGGVTVTVCEDKDGTDASALRAAEWVRENATVDVGPPAIAEGDTILQFGR